MGHPDRRRGAGVRQGAPEKRNGVGGESGEYYVCFLAIGRLVGGGCVLAIASGQIESSCSSRGRGNALQIVRHCQGAAKMGISLSFNNEWQALPLSSADCL